MISRIPLATYRLQLNAGFTFADAQRIAPYLAELGITDLYVSPILKARKGSMHGYDIVDASALNPELGSEDDFNALHETLAALGLGLLLDSVPNHMAASSENAWWMSVLENGPNSRFLHYFDIAWSPVTVRGQTVNKVLLPILGKPYGESLAAQEIRLRFDSDGFYFVFYDHRLPLAPQSYGRVLRDCIESMPKDDVPIEARELAENDEDVPNSKFVKETLWRIYEQNQNFRAALDRTIERFNSPRSFEALDELLDRQWYRLAYWRIASHKINYRRFFDVTDLIGVRVENPEVFEARNRRAFELVAEGKVTGVRIDHIDGLYDPVGFTRKLRTRLNDCGGSYIVLEKILARDEELPRELDADGTTGYDFLDSVNALFIDPAGLPQIDSFYQSFTGVTQSFSEICYERKKQVIQELFSGDMRSLGKQLSAIAMSDRNARDFAPVELTAALAEVTACLGVYRTYIRDGGVGDSEEREIREAVACARAHAGLSLDDRVFAFLERALLVDPPPYLAAEREQWLAFVMRWQQFTGRVMAKGVEDTALYNYNRLVSLNEVGGDPGREAEFDPVTEFHRKNCARRTRWPHTMNATTTHDTKRSEDARARIDVLSEIPAEWARQVRRWSRMNARLRRDGLPHANDELLFYQTLIGMWPLDPAELPSVPERLRLYLEKAAREAKTYTSWIAPNALYEEALLAFGSRIVTDAAFRRDFLRFQKKIAFYGAINSLAQVVLKAASPGVPDFYQGSELWDFSLVDPDNRRPVDYRRREEMLRDRRDSSDLLRGWADGGIKMFVTRKMLELRARHRELFLEGDYQPLDGGAHAVAFARGRGSESVVVVVPRLVTSLVPAGKFPLGSVWGDASLPIQGAYRDIFTGDDPGSALASIFGRFPVAVLERV